MQTQPFGGQLDTRRNVGYRILWVALIALLLCPLSALGQCTATWSGGASGSWNTSTNWTPAGVPTSTSNTCINTANSAVTVTGGATDNLTLGFSTDSLTIVNGQSLSITAGGNISNAGNIILSGTANNTFLIIAGATTLSGGGTVTMANANQDSWIEGAGTLTNQETIQGSGTIGNSALTLVNSGSSAFIDANNSANELVINAQGGTTNTGTLEATAGGLLNISGFSVANTGGTILATGAGSEVLLSGTSVTGGTLTTSSGGLIAVNGSTVTGITLSTGSNLQVNNGQTLTFGAGTITNNGTITTNGTANNTFIIVNGSTTLTGTGTVTMTNANQDSWIQGTGTLTNQETIQGSGTIGNSALTLINSATIDADQSNELILNPQGGTTNTGTLEATAGGTLQLESYAVTNTNGTILATGTGSVVLLDAGSITGGTLTSTAGGIIEEEGNTTLTNLTLSTGSNLQVLNGQTLSLGAGTITNNGTITTNGTANNTFIIVNGSTTLTGTGTVTMTNANQDSWIEGTGTLTNQETIQGSGTIGNSALTLINSATIDADQSNELILNPQGGTTNTGTLEATAGGTLQLESYAVTNTNGTILATGTGSVVLLDAGSITGGTLTSTAGGTFEEEGNTTLTNLTLSTGSNLQILNGQTLSLGAGTITNNGTITISGTANNTFLSVAGSTTLTGTGTVTMANANQDSWIDGGGTLTNQETIQGSGTIGNGNLTLVNSGTIDADNAGHELVINPNGGTTNTKTMEATSGGELEFRSDSVTNTGGTILATGTGSTVLLNGAAITGGTLTSSSGGVIDEEGNATLNTLTISTGTNVDVINGQSMTLEGTITNKGTINVDGTANNTFLLINGNVTLTAPGKVILDDVAGDNYIEGTGTLTNQGTIEGEGNIGNGQIGVVNTGTIFANEAGTHTPSTLYIDTGSAGFSNSSGTKNGTITVNAKNTVIIEGGAFLNFNGSTDTLTGGIYKVTGTLEFAGADIVTNDASITLTSATAKILNSSNNANALSGFDDNGTKGVFTVDSATFTDANVFTNSGTIAAGAGGKFYASNQLTNFNSSTSTLTGGSYTLTATGQFEFNNQGDSSDIVTNDASITLAGVDTTKSSIIDQTGANALANFAANGSTGSLTITTDRNYSTPGNFTNAGTVDITKSTGTGHTQLTIGSTGSSNYTQTGGTTTVDGLLTTTGAINIQGGFLYGNAGTLTGALDLTGGILSPGDGLKKLGDLNIDGSFTEGSSGDLTIDLDGTVANTKYDVLNVDGAAALGGTLTVDLVGTYKPVVGNTFDIVNYSSESGTFANLVLPTITGDHWTVSYNSTDIVLTLVAGAGPNVYGDDLTPAPGSVSGTPARRTPRFDALAASSDTQARWTRSTGPIASGAGFTHEPSAILTPAETCTGLRTFASFACLTKTFSGVATNVASAFHGSTGSERAGSTTISTLHNNVAAASTSGSAARYGTSHAPDTHTVSAASLARLYVCAYLPSDVASTMGCR